MPRPGPRPYECVRRSWHSDRHQPVRGSIIQQIFRVVHENHSPGTKKNREWQEKLPLVVLKSEEIMYSKANSEAEYMDPETLWDRVNDAINTIIRKDESMETGEFLPPCVEAALNLGCVPVRSSRSQRNSNTRSYLSPRIQDSGTAPPRTIDSALNAGSTNLPNVERLNVVNQRNPFSETNRDVRQNYKMIAPSFSAYPPSLETFPKQITPTENRASLGGTSSVYPLYYGLHFHPQVPEMRSHSSPQNSNAIIVGTPIFQAVCEPSPSSQKGFHGSLFPFDGDNNSSKNIAREETQPALHDCDLSLRLGLVPSGGKGFCPGDDDVGPSYFQRTPPTKELSFFPLNSEGDGRNLLADIRKRKAGFVNNNVVEGGKCFLQLEPSFDQINERMKRQGL